MYWLLDARSAKVDESVNTNSDLTIIMYVMLKLSHMLYFKKMTFGDLGKCQKQTYYAHGANCVT